MTLRLRLLLAYGYLVALLVVTTGSALLGFLRLSEGIDAVLEENFASISASMRMIESLERQDSAMLAALVEQRLQAPEMEELEQTFMSALEAASGNVTEPDEPRVLSDIRSGFAQYRIARDHLMTSVPARPLLAYDSDVFPLFAKVKTGVVRLLDINQNAMVEADRAARQGALRNGAWLGFLVAVGLLSLVVLSRSLQRDVLSRLEELRRGLEAVGAGDFQRRLREDGADELTAVARGVNALLDRHQSQQSSQAARLSLERQLVLALTQHHGERTTLFGLNGERFAGADLEEPAAQEVRQWIREDGRTLVADLEEPTLHQRVALESGAFDMELLLAARRPVGWIARRA